MEPNFRQNVIAVIKKIPIGCVATYGQIAAMAGSPRGGRIVGGILASLGPEEINIPWWRVVNRNGYLSIRGHMIEAKELQRELLVRERVDVSEEFLINLQQFGWRGDHLSLTQ